ncbi:hypothetical protein [Neisseria weixii]|nr:hypothetical protein [Neisseria weixii]
MNLSVSHAAAVTAIIIGLGGLLLLAVFRHLVNEEKKRRGLKK